MRCARDTWALKWQQHCIYECIRSETKSNVNKSAIYGVSEDPVDAVIMTRPRREGHYEESYAKNVCEYDCYEPHRHNKFF